MFGAALLAIVGTGCGSLRDPGTVFAFPALPEDAVRDRILWVEPVSILEPTGSERELIEVAYTYNLARFLRAQRWFRRVRVPPGPVEPGDWVAELRVERAVERSSLTPLAKLLFLPSLGTIAYYTKATRLSLELDATLALRDGAGRLLAESRAQHRAERRVAGKERGYEHVFFLDERARALEDLFQSALARAEGEERP